MAPLFALIVSTFSSPPLKRAAMAGEEVRQLAWAGNGTLVAVTSKKAYDVATGRSQTLRRFEGTIDDPIRRPSFRLLVNAKGTRAIGPGFLLDLKTMVSHPMRRAAGWFGNRLVEIKGRGGGKYSFVLGVRSVPVAPGWFVLGLSGDLRFALACRKEPFDGDDTFLLRVAPETGRASVFARYPKTSTDHDWLCRVQPKGSNAPFFVHSVNLASDLNTPFFAGKRLRPVEFDQPAALVTATSDAEWGASIGTWAIVSRRMVGNAGDEVSTLDLWNASERRTVRLAKAATPSSDVSAGRRAKGGGSSLGAYAVDWKRRRIAYLLNRNRASQIVVMGIGGFPK